MEEKQGSGKALTKLLKLVLTVVVPASFSFYFGQLSAGRDVIRSKRASVYATYVNAHRALRALQELDAPDAEDIRSQRTILNGARTELILYASKRVVESVTRAERAKREDKENLWKCETIAYFQAMRHELYAPWSAALSDEEISTILWPSQESGAVVGECKEMPKGAR